jgi:transposase
VWVFGALRVEDGKSLTLTSRSRNSKSYLKLLEKIERAIPRGLIYLIADNLKIHDSALVRKWLEEHPRIEHAFIPKGAAWLNLIEGWWRVFRRQAFAGQCFADSYEIDLATRVATRQLNRKASPWGYGGDHPNRRGIGGVRLCTTFEERSINGTLLLTEQ